MFVHQGVLIYVRICVFDMQNIKEDADAYIKENIYAFSQPKSNSKTQMFYLMFNKAIRVSDCLLKLLKTSVEL